MATDLQVEPGNQVSTGTTSVATSVFQRVRAAARSNPRVTGFCVGALALTLCILRSFQLGVDSNYDLLNYHLYKSISSFNGQLFTDVASAGLGTFLNPLIELPFAIMIAILGPQNGLIVGVAVVQFLCYWAVWRLTAVIAHTAHPGTVERVALLAVAVTGATGLSTGFTTFGDWASAAVLCESLRFALKFVRSDDHEQHLRHLAIAGVLGGCAVGLKMTAAPFAVGILIALALSNREVVAVGGRYVAGLAVGFAISAGPWMIYMTARYGSPLFPLYNSIFRSSSAPIESFDDTRYGASGPLDFVRFPRDLAMGTVNYSELAFRDWRYLGVIALVAMWVSVSRWSAWRDDSSLRIVVWTIGISYVLWLSQFGIYRYFLFGEILVSFVIVRLIFAIAARTDLAVGVVGLVAIIGVAFVEAPNWGRDYQMTSPQLAQLIDDMPAPPTSVVLWTGTPSSYLLHQFPKTTRSASLQSFGSSILYGGAMKTELDEFVESGLSSNNMVAITGVGSTTLPAPLDQLQLIECNVFVANVDEYQLCRVASMDAGGVDQ